MQPKFKLDFVLAFVLSCFLTSCKFVFEQEHCDESCVKLDVPLILQIDDYSCATTSIAMAISYFENKVLDKNEAWKISGSKVDKVKAYGNDMDGLKKIADFYGYKSEFRENLSFRDLEALIAADIPVVINILRQIGEPLTHAVLVVGYDSGKRMFYINDPAQFVVGKSLSYERLDGLWSARLSAPNKVAYRSAFIVYPNERKRLQ